MMKMFVNSVVLGVSALLFAGCMMAGMHGQNLNSSQEQEMTVGTVQREIKIGMSLADVAEALGSPNIVSNDDQGHETWIYDKIATEASYSQSSAGIGGGSGLILGGVSGSSGASSSTQKTLTVIIKFDGNSRVKSCKYHRSKF